MNTNSFFRTTMANSYTTRKFFEKVTSDLHTQLLQWDMQVNVELEEWRSYVVKVQYLGKNYRVSLSKNEIDLLQHESPYALDKVIWDELVKQGLIIKASEGNFLQKVFSDQLLNYRIS
ncbi:MAG: hypothetical protein KBT36_17875 [Kurthia sp.]|nr:hypothetical protein [Candidatus Kurthia equi]